MHKAERHIAKMNEDELLFNLLLMA